MTPPSFSCVTDGNGRPVVNNFRPNVSKKTHNLWPDVSKNTHHLWPDVSKNTHYSMGSWKSSSPTEQTCFQAVSYKSIAICFHPECVKQVCQFNFLQLDDIDLIPGMYMKIFAPLNFRVMGVQTQNCY